MRAPGADFAGRWRQVAPRPVVGTGQWLVRDNRVGTGHADNLTPEDPEEGRLHYSLTENYQHNVSTTTKHIQ